MSIIEKCLDILIPDIRVVLDSVRYIFRIGYGSYSLGYTKTAKDLKAYCPALVLFLPEKHEHEIMGNPNT